MWLGIFYIFVGVYFLGVLGVIALYRYVRNRTEYCIPALSHQEEFDKLASIAFAWPLCLLTYILFDVVGGALRWLSGVPTTNDRTR